MKRRTFLGSSLALALAPLVRADETDWPAWSAVGDVSQDQALLIAQKRGCSHMQVSWRAAGSGQTLSGTLAGPETGWISRVALRALPPGQTVEYEVRFADHQRLQGSFRTPPSRSGQPIRFCWSGDVCGQGWGIDPARGGMLSFASVTRAQPDFFLHSGDSVYADGPLKAEVRLADGSLWRNRLIPEKLKAAVTLDDYRGQHRYNLLDPHYRKFLSRVSVVAQWDDHEVLDNWDQAHHASQAGPARQAFLEYWPVRGQTIYRKISYGPDLDLFVLDLRSYRAPNSHNQQAHPGAETVLLGRQQLNWLKQELAKSRASWKFIGAEMPIATYNPRWGLDNWANGPGGPLGREWELAELLAFLKQKRIGNVVWLSADVHYAAAVHYAPERGVFQDFSPFWEFIAGPMHAGTFPSQEGPLDPTFGAQMVFDSVTPGLKPNRPPSEGLQFFGTVHIQGPKCRVSLHRQDGTQIFSQQL
ncbi:alkaline phosphatase D family protein [bacterium]|nr:alkaline phosphatase D family protein [bacterium]